MKSILTIIALFIAGIAIGRLGIIPDHFPTHAISSGILLLLLFQVGMGFGATTSIRKIWHDTDRRLLLLPLVTITGTIILSWAISFLTPAIPQNQSIAIGCGLGYYSMSSILISATGTSTALIAGGVALLSNIIREIMAITLAPVFYRISPLSPIAAAGSTSCDVSLSAIARACGDSMVPLSIVHGICCDISVPLLVTFFCSL